MLVLPKYNVYKSHYVIRLVDIPLTRYSVIHSIHVDYESDAILMSDSKYVAGRAGNA